MWPNNADMAIVIGICGLSGTIFPNVEYGRMLQLVSHWPSDINVKIYCFVICKGISVKVRASESSIATFRTFVAYTKWYSSAVACLVHFRFPNGAIVSV